MADLNRVIVNGRITREPEYSNIPNSGVTVAKFDIANNQKVKRGNDYVDEPNFFSVTFYGKGAEALRSYLVKGAQLSIDGKLKYTTWQGQDGKNNSKVIIIAENIQLLGQPSNNNNSNNNNNNNYQNTGFNGNGYNSGGGGQQW